ncbi:MAG: 2-amino-4-hydroxy-6-hydroxymethyldihydropteridine diphosphokinase [bacterium]
MESNVYVGLGSNLQNPRANLARARNAIPGEYPLLKQSSILRTEPFEIATEKPFFNQVLEINPRGSDPDQVLKQLLRIEQELGRDRDRNGPDRIIDLDLLYYNQMILHSDQLHVPHPEIHRRPFVLKSMVELNPAFLHPELEKTQVELLVNTLGKKSDN